MAAPRRPKTAAPDEKYVREPFIYGTKSGGEIELPSLSWLKPGVVRKLRHLDQVDQMYTLFEMHLSGAQLELLDGMDPDEFEDFCEQWKEHSGVGLGES